MEMGVERSCPRRGGAPTRRWEGVLALGLALGLGPALAGCPQGEVERRAEATERLERVHQQEERREALAEVPTAERIARASAGDLALEPPRTDWSGGDPARGQVLYVQLCVPCHGAAGRGDGPAAAALNPKPRDFTAGVFYLDADADAETGEPIDLARVIREGPEAFGGARSVPAWKGTFTETQLRDLVAYVLELSGSDPSGPASG